VKQIFLEGIWFCQLWSGVSLMYFAVMNFVIQKSRNIDRIVRRGIGISQKATPTEYLWKHFLEDA